VAALVLLFLYWNPSMRLFAAVLARAGFAILSFTAHNWQHSELSLLTF
jgi:hypothetical protein